MKSIRLKNNRIQNIENVIEKKTVQEWERLLTSACSPYALYSSPVWFDAVKSLYPENYRLVLIEDLSGNVKSVIPFEIKEKELCVSIGKIELIKYKFKCAVIMGGEPLGNIPYRVFETLLKMIIKNNEQITGISFKCIQDGSSFLSMFNMSSSSIHYVERAPEKFTYTKLGKTFEEYMAKFKKKARYNLRRQYRLALESSGNQLQLNRVTTASQVDNFVKLSKVVLTKSWKSKSNETEVLFNEKQCEIYKALAERNLFRSYILIADGEPWAFILGYQHQHIFHYSNIAFNDNFSNFSPGSVLFYKMVEDLFEENTPKLINYGIGDSQYKRRFGTDSFTSSDHILFKKTVKSYVVVNFFLIVSLLKKKMKIGISNNTGLKNIFKKL